MLQRRTLLASVPYVIGLIAATGGTSLVATSPAQAQEPAECLSPDPSDWPQPAKPYFMVIVDTSSSMIQCTNPATTFPATCPANPTPNACGMVPTRLNDAKCAMRRTIQAFSGQVNFGLAGYAAEVGACGSTGAGSCQSGVNGDCIAGGNCALGEDYQCTLSAFPDAVTDQTNANFQCGNNPVCNSAPNSPTAPNFASGAWTNGGNILVPMKIDAPTTPDNTAELLKWFDEDCLENKEIWARGGTPLAGSLQAVTQYLRSGWNQWDGNGTGAPTYCNALAFSDASPLSVADPGCRDLNIILVTDGDEACAGKTDQDAINAASDLFNNGVTFGSDSVRVHVINFAGGSQAKTDAIAAAGGTGTSISAQNEVQLAQALSNIISGSVQPEVCDNTDNNCNGCTDEGYAHYCNDAQTCETWTTLEEREDLILAYEMTIDANNPLGDLDLLPCVTPGDAADPERWLCYDPGDVCDDADNNCFAGVDEGATKCGSPASCPTTEICDGLDNDCNGLADDPGTCPNNCVPQPEICDGCDNDCDGIADNGVPAIACGFSPPANCAGTVTCNAFNVANEGECGTVSFNACSNNPVAETCDGTDQNCNGIIDDGAPGAVCFPPGTNAGTVFQNTNPLSYCIRGTQPCGSGQCLGGRGPTVEICDGIDNDCDGLVDGADSDTLPGVGQACGSSLGLCDPGVLACTNGALTCTGGTQPAPEVCDGQDNDCDGSNDELPLSDAPANPGCWNLPTANCASGITCGFPAVNPDVTWCAPVGGTCNGLGTLVSPCRTGVLACNAGGWVCNGGLLPSPEVCDGANNDCDAQTDEGVANTGQACGSDEGECVAGTLTCVNGVLECSDVGGTDETCNGLDDDCDGDVDEDLPVGGTCTPTYDTNDYPGDRSAAPCQPGTLQCDPNGSGDIICVGGLGPNPEVCDGADNDCDGDIDEIGPAPNGTDGTPNQFPPPAANIGDVCGSDVGACTEGQWACNAGQFSCLGSQGSVPESCDCEDNDCDGTTDEQDQNAPAICSTGKTCVSTPADGCQCASPCASGEFQCPAGQECVPVENSETGQTLGGYCIVKTCEDCASKTVVDADDNVLCAPAGTIVGECTEVPECVCQGQSGCQAPCFGVTCNSPLVCTNFGPNAGQCVQDTCFNFGCTECDEACNDAGACVSNPCAADDCDADEVCVPNADFTDFTCIGSCAGVECEADQICQAGACVDTCSPACDEGEYCDLAANPPACVQSLCQDELCPTGACCDPATGECGACPCEGVDCPDDQICSEGQCIENGGGAGGGGTGGGSTSSTGAGAGGTGGSGAVTSTGATGGSGEDFTGVWGLATGGGGCQCDMGSASTDRGAPWLALAAVAAIGARRRRRASPPAGEVVKEVQR